jgi:CheY-like chemotaxis protein
MHQVLLNLVVNARDAMPGGGCLTIETANVELDQTYVAQHPEVVAGLYVLLAVSDTGIGMDKATVERIFDPFFTTKGPEKGTGLGLSTAYGIVRQCGGWIWVYSEPGHGATFRIYLPRLTAPLAEEREPAPVPATLRGSETILVVEDQAQVRGLAVEVLQSYGYQVLEAATGGDALLLAERHPDPIALMITDVVMPRMTGNELAERLKPLRPNMRVLYMSGYTENAIVQRGILDCGVSYIAKPFAPVSLAGKVREVLDSSPPAAKVLVVDDEESIRGLFQKILEDAGYEVTLAIDGSQALDLLRDSAFDVVITDLVMPNREGIETIQAIRRQHPGMKIIAVSGAFGGSFLGSAKLLGAEATLVKPVGPGQLLGALRRVLE